MPPNCGEGNNLYYTLRLRVSNCFGESYFWINNWIIPRASNRPPPSGGGCPYVFVWNNDSTLHMIDNNLLHRSEFIENIGLDINDKYVLQIQPNLNFGKYSIQIGESENDNDYFDMIKLYAVDHPIGTAIGITESNDIVMYDTISVQSPDNATQNGSNITPYIQYYYHGKKIVSGITGDSIYAHYDSSSQMNAFKIIQKKYKSILDNPIPDSTALIGEIDRECCNKAPIGGISIFIPGIPDPVTRIFTSRQNMSNVIMPFSAFGDAVEHVDIEWYYDYSLTYFSVVPIMYGGFDVVEIPIFGALHSFENTPVRDILMNIDQNYVELNQDEYLNITFDSIAPPQINMQRDYVVEIQGRYIVNGSFSKPLSKSPYAKLEKIKFYFVAS